MATVIADRFYTPEDLLELPEGKQFELIDGQLLEKHMGLLECRIAYLITGLIAAFVEPRQLGSGFGSELGYRCFPFAPMRIRKPDASFISSQRLIPDMFSEGFATIAPDLAIEVVSPHDLYCEVEAKIDEYLRAGVRLVWVINPDRHVVRVHRLDGSVSEVSRDGQLSGEDVLPGFSTPVAPLFELPIARGDAGASSG